MKTLMQDEPPQTGTTDEQPQTARARPWREFRDDVQYEHPVIWRCPECKHRSGWFGLDSEAEADARKHWQADHAG
jgi:hypothetical protein